MKRTFLLVFLVLLCLIPLFAVETSYFNFGVGVSLSGRSNSVSSMSLEVVYTPFDFHLFNPSLKAWSGASWDGYDSLSFNGVGAGITLEIGRFMKNPLQFTLSNPGPWAPSLSAGVVFFDQYFEDIAALYLQASPFRTLDKDYMFEWFSPFVFIGFGESQQTLWGVSFFKFTPLYHF